MSTALETLNEAHDAWLKAVSDASEALDNLSPGGLGDKLRDASLAYETQVSNVLGETKQDLAAMVLRELLSRMEDEHRAALAAVLNSGHEIPKILVDQWAKRLSSVFTAIGELEAWKEDGQ